MEKVLPNLASTAAFTASMTAWSSAVAARASVQPPADIVIFLFERKQETRKGENEPEKSRGVPFLFWPFLGC